MTPDECKKSSTKATKKDDEDTNDSINSDDTIENVDLNESQSDDRSLKEIQNEEREEIVIKEIVIEEKKDDEKNETDVLKDKLTKDPKSDKLSLSDYKKVNDEIENNSENTKQDNNLEKNLDKKDQLCKKIEIKSDLKIDSENDFKKESKPDKFEMKIEEKPTLGIVIKEVTKNMSVNTVKSNQTVGSVVNLFKLNSDQSIDQQDISNKIEKNNKDEIKQTNANSSVMPNVQILITKSTNSSSNIETNSQNKSTFIPLTSTTSSLSLNKVCLPQVKPINVNQTRTNGLLINDSSKNNSKNSSINNQQATVTKSNLCSSDSKDKITTKQIDIIVTKPNLTSINLTSNRTSLMSNNITNSMTNNSTTKSNGLPANLPKPIPINSSKLLNGSLSSNHLTINNLSSPLSSNNMSLNNLSNSLSNSLTNKLVNSSSKTFTPIVSPVVNLNQVSPNLIKNNLANLSSSIEKIKMPSFIKNSTSSPLTKPTTNCTVSSISNLMNKQTKMQDSQTFDLKPNNSTSISEKASIDKTNVLPQFNNFKQTSNAILQAKQKNVRRISPPPIFWQKHNHLIDQVVVTDVKSEDVSITIRESKTPIDFFKKNAAKKKKNLNKIKLKNLSICSNGSN